MSRDPRKHPSRYHIFVLSLWEEGGDYPGRAELALQPGKRRAERKGFKNLAELMAYLEAWTQSRRLRVVS